MKNKKLLYIYCFASKEKIKSFNWEPKSIKVKLIPIKITNIDSPLGEMKNINYCGALAFRGLVKAHYPNEFEELQK